MRRIGLLLLLATTACAAEHGGVVRFHNQPVPGATVRAVQGAKRVSTVTDAAGRYTFPDLADGACVIRVELLCFRPIEREIRVAPNEPPAAWDLEMLPVAAIQTAAAAAGPASVLSSAGTPPAAETSPAPPARPPAPDPRSSPKAAVATPPEPAPAPPDNASDSFLINGSVNNSAASTFSQSSAFGNMRKNSRYPFRFAVSATFGNAVFDARPYSLTGLTGPKAGYSQTQGAVSLFGPLMIPRILPLRRGNPFVFFSYQWVRNRNASNQAGLVPTEAERAGDLSRTLTSSGNPVRFADPETGAAVSGNRIPASRISPQAKTLLSLYPMPNAQGVNNYNYEATLRGTSNSDTIQTEVSHSAQRNGRVSGQLRWQRNSTDSPNLLGFNDATHGGGLNAAAIWSGRIRNKVFATVRLEYNRMSSRLTPFFAYKDNVSERAGIKGNNQDPENWGPPALSFSSGLTEMSDGRYSLVRNQTTGVIGSFFWMHGAHTIQGGADARRQQFNTLGQEDPRGMFSFSGAATGSDLAGLLFGIPDASRIAFGNADKYLRAGMYSTYVNDDWRVTQSLSVNAGLRWEYASPMTELHGRLVNLDIAPGFAAVSPVVASSPVGTLTGIRYPKPLLRTDKPGLQPRVAIAWKPMPLSSLLVRAGYGIYYDSSVYQAIAGRMMQQPPLSTSFSVENSPAVGLTVADGFRRPASEALNTFAVDPDFQVGYSQIWQAKLQRDFPWAMVLSAGYLGTKGTRAQQQFLPNTWPTGATGPCGSCPSGFVYLTSNGNSTRHAAQVQLRRRMQKGFLASLDYTFAKAIDNASLGGRGEGSAVIAQDWRNLRGERGPSTFDQRHLLTVDTQYTTGIETLGGRVLRGWRGAVFGGWTIGGSLKLGSGLPLMPVYFSVVQGTGVTGSVRPDYTGTALYEAPVGRWLNPAAVAAPQSGQWGNAGRNSITGPAQFGLSSSVDRSFHDGRLEVRADADNVLNHVVYKAWNTSITSTQFGLPTAANGMRTVRMTVRVRF